MKLSLSWIFDHIQASWRQHNIHELVDKFNTRVAEIERIQPVDLPLSKITIVSVVAIDSIVTAYSTECAKEFDLSMRLDAAVGNLYLIIERGENGWDWAQGTDFGGVKDVYLPAISCPEVSIAGAWKNVVEAEDYIVEIDNKSITHRPDLWSHRGVAREIAALLKKPLVAECDILAQCQVREYEHFAAATQETPLTVTIDDVQGCSRFAIFYIPHIPYMHSWLWMAQRLARISAKPINAIVDLTNYVMFDIGQPLHAFDADAITTCAIGPRKARLHENIVLLDGQEIELTQDDIVIAEKNRPIALAGIMGGKETAVSEATRSIVLEAAHFDAVSIRKSAQRYKLRTESSARFEKTLDSHLNIIGLQRFLFLLSKEGINISGTSAIVSLGKVKVEERISIAHSFIEQKLGIQLDTDQIKCVLRPLGFEVNVLIDDGVWYDIQVPTFRSSKDILISEDIVEEVARCVGFDTIPQVLPAIITKTHDNSDVFRMRAIKQFFAFAFNAQEVQNYPLYDEIFLKELAFNPKNFVKIKNPQTEQATCLVTSLIPHLLKNVVVNANLHSQLRFFEWGRIWYSFDDISVVERKSLAGIVWLQKQDIDFYTEKKYLTDFLNMVGCSVLWGALEKEFPLWYHPHKSAQIRMQGYSIGYAGLINPLFIADILPGNAFIFELDGDFLLSYRSSDKLYVPLSKFQKVVRDISCLVPKTLLVQELESQIMNLDERIESVLLIDFFESSEWDGARALTMRVIINDIVGSISKEDIDILMASVTRFLQKLGAQVR